MSCVQYVFDPEGWELHLELLVKLQLGGWNNRKESGGVRGSHMAADSERGQSCQGRASWDGRREVKGGNHPGRTTRFPSAKTQDSSGLCVRECVCVYCCLRAVDWQQCWLNPTWRLVSWQHWCHKSGQDLECLSDVRARWKKVVCALLCSVLCVWVCMCVCAQRGCRPASTHCGSLELLYQLGEPGA